MEFRMRLVWMSLLLLLAGWLAVPACAQAPAYPPATTPAEAELGKKTAESIEKEYKLVNDEAALKRLTAIVNAIAPVTQRPQVVYTCKILDTGGLNAMAIPGGTIYVTKGLLNAVESDDELAGVLAHEIAHNALTHARKLMEREAKLTWMQLITAVSVLYASRGSDISAGQVITMSELVKQALVNGYTVTLESEADAHAVRYLHALRQTNPNSYNPVGLYSVILGFLQMSRHRADVELGYLKTHPYDIDRKKAIEAEFARLKIPINLWQVVNFRATVVPPTEAADRGYTLKLGSVDVLTLTETALGSAPKARAEEAAAAINKRLQRAYVQQYDVTLTMDDNQANVRIRNIPVLTLTDQDARAAGMTLEALGQIARARMRESIWREVVKREG